MKREDCPGTLLSRARKNQLSLVERAALDAHLEGCDSCRILELVATDFDQESISERHDGARIERLASLARQATFSRQRSAALGERRMLPNVGDSGQRGVRVLLFAAAAFLLVAGASAGLLVQRAVREQQVPVHPVHEPISAPLVAQGAAVARARERQAAELEVQTLETINAEAAAESSSGQCATGQCGVSAKSLFRQANEARRGGNATTAIRLYQSLQRRYPSSPQAQLSHVSLGHLLLSSGQPRQALAQFNLALGPSGNRSVAAEALYGKGLSLSRLGSQAEEAAIWKQLIARFPSSPYVAHAKQRLND